MPSRYAPQGQGPEEVEYSFPGRPTLHEVMVGQGRAIGVGSPHQVLDIVTPEVPAVEGRPEVEGQTQALGGVEVVAVLQRLAGAGPAVAVAHLPEMTT